MKTVTTLQDNPAKYGAVSGSPHLNHASLNARLVSLCLKGLGTSDAADRSRDVLEVGAGHGGFTVHVLAAGYSVVATEVSRALVGELEEQFGTNPGFAALYDADGSLNVLNNRRFSGVLYASVLHHIPDYESAIRRVCKRHLLVGGALVTVQDPLWYPSIGRFTRVVSGLAYFAWRIGQGNYLRGLRTRARRAVGQFDVSDPSDTVEYHVVRRGVDERSLELLLSDLFETVTTVRYWSTQSPFWQRLGEMMGLQNTFAFVATEYRDAS